MGKRNWRIKDGGRVSKIFGAWLYKKRHELNLSQAILAEKCGLHIMSVGKMERGESTPTILSVILICQGLGISIYEPLSLFRDFQIAIPDRPKKRKVPRVPKKKPKQMFTDRFLENLVQNPPTQKNYHSDGSDEAESDVSPLSHDPQSTEGSHHKSQPYPEDL